jgi:hypothetical protein
MHRRDLNLKRRFGDWTLSPSSGKKRTMLGPIDRASPYLRTPEPTQNIINQSGQKPSAEVKAKNTYSATCVIPCTYGHAQYFGQST